MISFCFWFFALCSLSVYVRDFLCTLSMFHAFGRDFFWILGATLYFRCRIHVCFSVVVFSSLRSLRIAWTFRCEPADERASGRSYQRAEWMFGWAFTTAIWCLFFFVYSFAVCFCFSVPFDSIDFGFRFFSDYTHSWSCKLLIRINQACIIVYEHISICVELVASATAAVFPMNIKSVNMFSLFLFILLLHSPFCRPPPTVQTQFCWATQAKEKGIDFAFFLY